MNHFARTTLPTLILILTACQETGRGNNVAEVNEALTNDGGQRYCGLGRVLNEIDDDVAALYARLTLRPDGMAELEQVVGRIARSPVAYPDRLAPLIDEPLPWRGNSYPRLTIGRVDARLVLAERGLRPGGVGALERRTLPNATPRLNPRRAIRARVLYANQRRGPAMTFVPCASLAPALAEDLEVRPRWELDAATGAAEFRRRRTPAAGAATDVDLAPRGFTAPRMATAADRGVRWCGVELEFDTFRPRRVRTLSFGTDGARLIDHVYDGARVESRPGAAARLQPVLDDRGTPLFIDVNRADFTDGWFRPCTDPALTSYLVPFAGVAF